ncbi:MAG: hypothetical protein HY547_06930 [Elusimicrobia bacterium]|nr:hypothetical protein [Elusimicrobiota bacterium]
MKIFAHRGGAQTSAENTLDAVRRAAQMGADGVELDVQLSADGEIIIFHDDDLRRLAHDNRLVSRLNFKELRQIKILDRHQIPHLHEVLELLNLHSHIECFFDLHTASRSLTERLAKEISALKPFVRERCRILGFYDPYSRELEFVKNHFPELHISLMPQYPWKFLEKIKQTGARSLCIGWDWNWINRLFFKTASPWVGLKTEIAQAQAAGAEVSGGIGNSWQDMAWIINQGATGIWTDDLELGLKFRDQTTP